MSYNTTSFANNPEMANSPGVFYFVVLVNKKTFEREGCKIGITKGTSWKDAVKRSKGFTGSRDSHDGRATRPRGYARSVGDQ